MQLQLTGWRDTAGLLWAQLVSGQQSSMMDAPGQLAVGRTQESAQLSPQSLTASASGELGQTPEHTGSDAGGGDPESVCGVGGLRCSVFPSGAVRSRPAWRRLTVGGCRGGRMQPAWSSAVSVVEGRQAPPARPPVRRGRLS